MRMKVLNPTCSCDCYSINLTSKMAGLASCDCLIDQICFIYYIILCVSRKFEDFLPESFQENANIVSMIKCIFQVNFFLIFGTLIREVKQQLTRNDLNHYGFGFLTQIWKILLCGNITQFKKHKLRIKPRNLNCIVNLDWFDHFNLKRAFNAVSA